MIAPANTEELLAVLEQNGWRTATFRSEVPPVWSSKGANAQEGPQPVEQPQPQHQESRQQDPGGPFRVSDWVAREAAIAYGRIRPFVRHTPLEPSPWLSSHTSGAAAGVPAGPGCCRAFLKLESEQHTGSFKVRGALNKLLSLPSEMLSRGIVTASTGNHALAVVYAAAALSAAATGSTTTITTTAAAAAAEASDVFFKPQPDDPLSTLPKEGIEVVGRSPPTPLADLEARSAGVAVTDAATGWVTESGGGRLSEAAPVRRPQIFVPKTASPYKVRKLQALGAQLHVYGAECLETESAARGAAAAAGAVYVSPYNDLWVMGGQGTVALELLAARRKGQLDVVLVPAGGGGLIGGVASVLKAADPGIKVVGCQPALSDVMARSVAAGAVQPEIPVGGDVGAAVYGTLSDATAGGVEHDTLTLQPCIECVDEWVVMEENEIAAALVELLEEHSKLVEGAAACALAAFKRLAPRLAGLSVVAVCCGGNIALPALRRALDMARPDAAQCCE